MAHSPISGGNSLQGPFTVFRTTMHGVTESTARYLTQWRRFNSTRGSFTTFRMTARSLVQGDSAMVCVQDDDGRDD